MDLTPRIWREKPQGWQSRARARAVRVRRVKAFAAKTFDGGWLFQNGLGWVKVPVDRASETWAERGVLI